MGRMQRGARGAVRAWIAACSHLVEHAPAELLQTYAQVHGGELARLAGNLPGRVPGLPEPRASDPETERYLLFSSVAGLLEHVAQTAPVGLVLDDLQWADTQSLALLKHVLHGAEQSSVIVIVTYRDSDLGKDHPLTGCWLTRTDSKGSSGSRCAAWLQLTSRSS